MPGGAGWKVIVGAGCLAGIGFTMSLFVASLSLEGGLLREAKTGILAGSTLSALLGIGILSLERRQTNSAEYTEGSEAKGR